MLITRLRQILIITLLCTNVILGFLSFSLIRRLNSGYSDLLGRSVPIISNLHSISTSLRLSYHAAVKAVYAHSDSDRQAQMVKAEEYEATSTKLREEYQRSPDLLNGAKVDIPIETAARNYHDSLTQLLKMLHAGQINEAKLYRSGALVDSSEEYFELLEQRITMLDELASKIGRDYTATHSRWQRVVLTVGAWPLIAAAIGLVSVIGLVIVLMISVFIPRFRKRQA